MKQNKKLALAWFRESVRNGNFVSYLNAGDLLVEMDQRLFGLAQFLGAYQNGAFFLKEKIEDLRESIAKEDGLLLPDILFIDESKIRGV